MRTRLVFSVLLACACASPSLVGCGSGTASPDAGSVDDDQAAVDAAANALTFDVIARENASEDEVKTELELPSVVGDNVQVSWESSADIIDSGGAVGRETCVLEDVSVTLTAALTRGEASATVIFDLTVPRHTDEEAVDLARAALEAPTVEDIEDLDLPAEGVCETAIAWASDSPLVDVETGEVVASYQSEEVTLTATLSRGGAEEERAFSLSLAEGAFTCRAWELLGADDTDEGFAFGDGDLATEPYYVCTAAHLDSIRHALAADVVLGADIDLDEYAAGAGWLPIGRHDDPFTGAFDGRGRAISGLAIDRDETDYVGLFAAIAGATVRDVSLTSVHVVGNDQVGAIAGEMFGGALADVAVAGYVQAKEGLHGGGLVGRVRDGATIERGASQGQVRGSGNVIGGLIGLLGDGTLRASSSSAAVDGGDSIGGAVGMVGADGVVQATFATGSSSAEDQGGKTGARAGGLVGFNLGTISDSFARGAVDAEVSNAGGLVGHNGNGGIIERSYATGEVESGASEGGLIGNNSGAVIDSYFDVDAAATGDGVGFGSDDGVFARSTDDMTLPFDADTYETWDFVDVWIGEAGVNDGYPSLR